MSPEVVYFLNDSAFVRFYNSRDQRGRLGQPPDKDSASNQDEGGGMPGTNFSWGVSVVGTRHENH